LIHPYVLWDAKMVVYIEMQFYILISIDLLYYTKQKKHQRYVNHDPHIDPHKHPAQFRAAAIPHVVQQFHPNARCACAGHVARDGLASVRYRYG
jgi:hypothetical protein